MKKILPLLTLAICTLFVSCDKPDGPDNPDSYIIWDIVPSRVVVTLEGQSGADLLDKGSFGNYLDRPIYAIYKGKRYDMAVENRAIMPQELGLRLSYNERLKCNALWFGEFDSQDKYQNESFTLHYGNDESQVIGFDISTSWSFDHQKGYDVPDVHNSVSVNGQLFDNTNHASIVIDSLDDGWIWDFIPSNISISISDIEGNDLLDPEVEGTLRDRPLYVIYDGEKFDAQSQAPSRMLPADWYGLTVKYYDELKCYALLLGEIDVVMDYRKKPFTLYYGDNKSKLIEIDSYITWQYSKEDKRNNPTVHKNLYIDDKVFTDTHYAEIVVE